VRIYDKDVSCRKYEQCYLARNIDASKRRIYKLKLENLVMLYGTTNMSSELHDFH
jgi:hypothetical protein